MTNLYLGLPTVFIATLFYFIAYKKGTQYKIVQSLLFILLAGLCLRFYTATDFFLHAWDERYHALVAKNMMAYPFKPMLYAEPLLAYDFKSWTSNHIWLHKQPLPLWTMALSMKLFGIHEIGLRLPSILLSTLAIYLTYFIGTYFYNNKIGLLAAFFHSIHGLITELTGGRVTTDHTDIFFLFFIEFSIFLGIKYLDKKKFIYLITAGVALGCALLSKWLPALIVLPVLVSIYIFKEKYNYFNTARISSIIIGAATIIALPWQLYIHYTFPVEATWENTYNWMHFTQTLESHKGGIFYHILKMRILWGELIYLPLIWFTYRFFKKKKHHLAGLWVWIFLPYLFFSFAATKMQAYVLFTAPAIFTILGAYCYYLSKINFYPKIRWLNLALLTCLVALPVRYGIERIKPFQKRDRSPSWVHQIKRLGHQHKQHKTILLNCPYAIEAMFYTDMIAYTYKPDEGSIDRLKKEGYQILDWTFNQKK